MLKPLLPRSTRYRLIVLLVLAIALGGGGYLALGNPFDHSASPLAGPSSGLIVGSKLYASYCSSCHGFTVTTLKTTDELEQMLAPKSGDSTGAVREVGRTSGISTTGEVADYVSGPHRFANPIDQNDASDIAEYVIANQPFNSSSSQKALMPLNSGSSTLYLSNCSGCHGTRGDQVAAANLADKTFWERRDTSETAQALARGAKGMPAFGLGQGGQLDDDQLKEIVRASKVLATAGSTAGNPISYSQTSGPDGQETSDGAEAQAPEAAKLYAATCAACHGPDGSVLKRFDLGKKAFWQPSQGKADPASSAEQAVSAGEQGMPALGQATGGPLSDSQIASIIDYLRDKAVVASGPVLRLTSGPTPQAFPTPTPIPPRPPLNSQPVAGKHPPDWLKSHKPFVVDNGAASCYKCHTNQYCANCHVKP